MEHVLLIVLLVLTVGSIILGISAFLWSVYQDDKQTKEMEALRIRKQQLREEFINLYGGEEKFYHDMMVACKMAREAANALSMCNWVKKYDSDPYESADAYLKEHKEKAAYYYIHNPEFKLRDYIQLHLNN